MSRRIAVLATAAALALTGCSSSGNGTSATPSGAGSASASAGGDLVSWSEKVCQAVFPQMTKLQTPPSPDPTDPQKSRQSMVDYLGVLEGALDSMVSGVKAAGAPPVTDGQQAADKMVTDLQTLRSAMDGAKAKLAAATVTDAASFQVALQDAGTELQKVGSLDPTKDLTSTQELQDAFDKAPTCRKMNPQAPPTS